MSAMVGCWRRAAQQQQQPRQLLWWQQQLAWLQQPLCLQARLRVRWWLRLQLLQWLWVQLALQLQPQLLQLAGLCLLQLMQQRHDRMMRLCHVSPMYTYLSHMHLFGQWVWPGLVTLLGGALSRVRSTAWLHSA